VLKRVEALGHATRTNLSTDIIQSAQNAY